MVMGAWVVVVVEEKGDGGAGVTSGGCGGTDARLLESPVAVVIVVVVVEAGGGLTSSALSSFCTLPGLPEDGMVSVWLVREGNVRVRHDTVIQHRYRHNTEL